MIDLVQPAHHHLSRRADRPGPTEALLNAFPLALTDLIADVPGGSGIDGLQGASWAGATSALVSAVVLIVVSPFLTGSPAVGSTLRGAPIWIWFGVVLDSVYLFAAVFSVQPLGAAGVVATAVLGQLVGAVLLDTFGFLHPAVPLTWQRLLGCALAIAGVWLVTQRA